MYMRRNYLYNMKCEELWTYYIWSDSQEIAIISCPTFGLWKHDHTTIATKLAIIHAARLSDGWKTMWLLHDTENNIITLLPKFVMNY